MKEDNKLLYYFNKEYVRKIAFNNGFRNNNRHKTYCNEI